MSAQAATIKGLLFDKDGTLIDFQNTWPPIFMDSIVALAERLGCPALAHPLMQSGGLDPVSQKISGGSQLAEGTSDSLVDLWLTSNAAFEARARQHFGDTPSAAITTLLDRHWADAIQEKMIAAVPLPPLMKDLHGSGYRLGMATNDSAEMALATSHFFQISHWLDFHAGYDSGHGAKPDPGMILAFAAKTALAPHEIAMIGDSPADMQAGRRAGVGLKIAVLTGACGRAQLAPLADLVLDDISEIPDVLSAHY